MENCTFINNTCREGGVFYLDMGKDTIKNCIFINNTATNQGGAIHIYNDDNTIENCTFINNTADNGGAISCGGFSCRNNVVENCSFVNNKGNQNETFYLQSENNVDIDKNWWSSNNPDFNTLIVGKTTPPASYAVLNITADPSEIAAGEKSSIVTKFVLNGTNTDVTSSLPKRNVKLTTNGTLTKTEGDVGLTSEFSATSEGIYYVNATVDDEIIGVNVNVNSSVPKKDLNLNASTFTIGENITVIVTGFENATGNITVTAGDDNYTSSIMMGMAFVSIPKSDKNITAYIYYPGDDKYNNASTTVDIIAKKDLNLTAVAEPVTVGENATIIVNGFENATGNVMVIAGRGFYNVTIMNGTAKAITKGLNNTTTAYILYLGDDNYNMAFTSVNITVNPNPDRKNLTLKGSAEPIIVGQNATIIVTGFENATGDVSARVEGGTLYTSIVNGTATFTVPDLTSSTTAYIIYEGDDNYNAANTTVYITVYPKSDVNIVAENVTKYYHGPERFVANIYDSELNPMVNKSVNITINGVTYTRTTDDNGSVSMAINLGSSTYEVTTQVDNTTVKSTITVLSTVTGSDLTKYYRNATQYSVQLFNTNGKAVGKGEVVTFNINGIFYNRTTDENGIATLNINLPSGNYIITSDYKGCKIANNITVLPVLNATDITMKYLDGTQFKVNLVDGQGNPYKDQFVRFNINGKFYDRLTDGNGQAALNIRLPAGEYIITSSFNGANIANKITITS